ncbi:MrcB family domain-containing protein [Rhizobium leguminosarum]|uniref:MrcB family domain-containing protein n=1 Tax=Rhizobium leguminosarum TaxID=384 RepID=UPI001C97B741|nr:DUF3578 domain-containing protein [Rhizobium leguminosarum]MBY5418886.1 DUF3578 domain-containing protein [Rhizobium leguminosarum]
MTIRETILNVRANWEGYREKITTAKDHEVYRLVVEVFPRELERQLPAGATFTYKGSTGVGNITKAPWVATFDPAITTQATQGFYVVYLFSVDLQRLYISLAFGTTQFSYFGLSDRHRKLRESARHLQGLLRYPRPVFLDALDLAAGRGDRLHADYEQSNIAAIEYDLTDLPAEDTLAADYRYLVDLYQQLIRHPLLPGLQQLFEAAVDPVPAIEPEVRDFTVRKPKKNRKGGGAPSTQRRSLVSKKVGDRGEEIVFNYECLNSVSWGYSRDAVQWLAKEGKTPGWDITSINQAGEEIFIEVKSSVGPNVTGLLMTANEWLAAAEHGDRYYIYIVTDVMQRRANIEVIRNPARLVKDGHLTIVEAAWALGLHPSGGVSDDVSEELLEER